MATNKKGCKCATCGYGHRVSDFVQRMKADADKAFIRDIYDRMIHAEDDAEYWEMKAKGTWPGDTE